MDRNHLFFDEVLEQAVAGLCVPRGEGVHAVFDTNAVRYRWATIGAFPAKAVLHVGVVGELARLTDVFSEEGVGRFAEVLSPRIVVANVFDRDRKLIDAAVREGSQKTLSRSTEGIGAVDVHTLGYILERARLGKYSVAVSDDPDILYAIDWMRQNERFVADHVGYVSPRRHILNQHAAWLGHLNAGVRRGFEEGLVGKYEVI